MESKRRESGEILDGAGEKQGRNRNRVYKIAPMVSENRD